MVAPPPVELFGIDGVLDEGTVKHHDSALTIDMPSGQLVDEDNDLSTFDIVGPHCCGIG